MTVALPLPTAGKAPGAPSSSIADPGGVRAAALGEGLRSMSQVEGTSVLLGIINDQLAAVTGEPKPGAWDPTAPWRGLGIYRGLAEELRARLSTATGVSLSATVFFDHPTPRALADHLRAEILGLPLVAGCPLPAPEGKVEHDDPIVIVGMGCRYPGGVRSPEQLWQLAAEGRDVVTTLPTNRGWILSELYDPEPGRPGKTSTCHGGFIEDVDQFDPAFFGISPREAKALDPQQRLLLETAWEALERAGIEPTSLAGSRTGVFVGIAYQDYGPSWDQAPQDLSGQLLLGSLTSAASGRIAYTLGLEGPALTVDTACSSSLVSLHIACQSLRTGECSLALAGGATVMATPGLFLEFSAKRGLAPDGRCKAFSADADGTGWGEGAGMLVLERMSEARRQGHPILALVRGTAINQDGASNGLTAPNGPAQQRVIRQALANAGLSPLEVDAVEAHGTGTTLGDPIEAQALIATYGRGRLRDRPLWLGSLKSNIGHTQAAAAVGGIIKTVMAFRHGVLPKSLHVSEPTPHVDWSTAGVSLLTESKPWPRAAHPRRAGISAFGVCGTNGHAILEEAPWRDAEAPDAAGAEGEVVAGDPAWLQCATSGFATAGVVPCPLSAKSAGALRAQAEHLRVHLQAHPEQRVLDVGYSLAARARFKHRAVILPANLEGLLNGLDSLARGCPDPGLVQGCVERDCKLACVFTGQGAQRLGMGQTLYLGQPAFAEAFDAVCARLDPWLARPLNHIVFAPEGSLEQALLDQTVYAQAALFALEVALFRWLEGFGLTPAFVLGHSIGELAAAHVARVLSLDDACTLVAARGTLMQACRPGGAMVALEAHEREVIASLNGWESEVAIATINGPRSIVIAGDEARVSAIARTWEVRGRKTQRLRVSHAFHSPHMESMLEDFRRVAQGLTFQSPVIPLVSSVTGRIADNQELCSPEYWVRQVRQPVRFFAGMQCLEAHGAAAFLEVGPDAVLTAMGPACLSDERRERAVFVPALRRGRPDLDAVTTAVAQLHVRGVDLDLRRVLAERGGELAELPTYPFQRERYWLDSCGGLVPGPAPRAPVTESRYRVTWKRLPDALRSLDRTWLVLADVAYGDQQLLSWLVSGLAGRGARVRLLLVDGAVDRAFLGEQLAGLAREGVVVGGVLSLLALDDDPHLDYPAMTLGLARTVELVQALMTQELAAPLWCVTRGAVSVADSDLLRRPAQAMIWGLGRTVGLEHPSSWGGLVDLPEVLDDRVLRDLCAALAGREREDQVALRNDGVFVRRLVAANRLSDSTLPAPGYVPRGTILITGGTGALGAQAAQWLARHGAEHLVLLSRRGPREPRAEELRASLTELGAAVTIVPCNVANRDELGCVLASLPAEPPLTAVVHAAGVSGRFCPFTEVSLAEFAEVIAGKVAGAANLDALLGDRPLDAFVCMSSIAGVWGSGGQSAYGAGNAWLDALAQHRRGRGLAATSVAWGPCADQGMAADPAIRQHLAERGLRPMAPATAIDALWQAVAAGDVALTVAEVDWPRFHPTFTVARTSHFFDELPSPSSSSGGGDPPDRGVSAWQERLARAQAGGRAPLLLELVRTEAAVILGHQSPENVDPDVRFLDLGFDSLASVELRQRLATVTGLKLETTLVFDHPTPSALARDLEVSFDRAQGSRSGDPSRDEPVADSGRAHEEDATRRGWRRLAAAMADDPGRASVPAGSSGSSPGEPGTLRCLYRQACDQGVLDVGIDLLKAAAQLRPIFRTPAEFGKPLESVQLAAGSAETAVVCFPPFVAPCGPHNYARLALDFDGLRDVHAFANPGFGEGEPVPASTEVILETYVEALASRFRGKPLATVGYSSGGWFAHAIAGRLEALGMAPRAVILIDSLALKADFREKVRPPLINMAINERAFALMTNDQLTAMITYFRLFEHWRPVAIETPILVVRSNQCIPEWQGDQISNDYWKASWDLPHEILEVPGDHSTIMNENASSTARALHRWLREHLETAT